MQTKNYSIVGKTISAWNLNQKHTSSMPISTNAAAPVHIYIYIYFWNDQITGGFAALHDQSPASCYTCKKKGHLLVPEYYIILLSHGTGQNLSPCYRAHLVKRKMDTMKEERRRQDILTKRREQIREATERYQRLKKNYMPESGGLYPHCQMIL